MLPPTTYLVPAVVIFALIVLFVEALASFGIGVAWRRVAFVVLVTLGVAPAIAPAEITTVYVPNGVMLGAGALPMLHLPRLVTFAVCSFGLTALVATLLSFTVVARVSTQSGSNRLPAKAIVKIALVVLAFGLYRASLPDRHVNPQIDWSLVETFYGPLFDRVEALTLIEDSTLWQDEVEILRDTIKAETGIVSLFIAHDSNQEHNGDRRIEFVEGGMTGSCSSSAGSWRHHQLMRCTRRSSVHGRIETMLYRRISVFGDDSTYIDVELDYEKLLDRLDRGDLESFSIDANSLLIQQDAAIMGPWSIDKRYERTLGEHRDQSGRLWVGPRRAPGEYAVRADIEIESRLRKSSIDFDRPECEARDEICHSRDSATGTLRIRGTKVQIIYDKPGWNTDILTLDGRNLVGRTLNWGSAAEFSRNSRSGDAE